jgi:plasmid stability protein
MKRSLIQFDEETYQKLRQRAFQQERSISSLVREIVVKTLGSNAGRARPRHVSQFLSVAAGRSQQGRLSPISEKHDEALAATVEK